MDGLQWKEILKTEEMDSYKLDLKKKLFNFNILTLFNIDNL